MNFTDKVANYIFDQQLPLADLTIVLPSERAKKYLAASLFNVQKKSLLAPKMITMDQWIRMNTPQTIIDKTRALVRLFEIQLTLGQSAEDLSFDEFLEWGPILLSDFDEIDRYLVDAEEVFKDLHNIKELEYWKLDSDEQVKLSDARKRFLEFWERLPVYYKQLNEKLKEQDACYFGSAYKFLANNIDVLFKENKQAQFLFAGFNAMSKAEMSILKQLHRMGRGHIIIDGDAFYVNDSNHEAGDFIRKQRREFEIKDQFFIENKLLTKAMDFEVIECAQTTGQVKVAATKLLEMPEHQIQETLVLLADESLIAPLLKNIPRKVGKTNITLGLPMKSTAIKNWVDILFAIQESLIRFNTKAFYHNDLKRLLNHPFLISCMSDQEKMALQRLDEVIIQKNWIFINGDKVQLGSFISDIIQLVGEKWNGNYQLAMKRIRQLNTRLFKELSKENQFERALIQSFDQALIEFQNIVSEGLPPMSLRSFRNLFTQHWSNKGIAYHGNPIDGLQVMGLLETRLLDFKTIICLGMNEGIMPPTNPIQSMLPMDLRRYAGLPLPRDKQGLFAHHFYRLLHGCDHLIVTYSGAKESLGSTEKSRYLLQLEKELLRKNQNINYSFKYYTIPMEEDRHVDLLSIPKDESIFNRMDELFARSTSFSTLQKYVSCPLDFYYKYVLEFGEEDTVEEELESSTFGTIVHETLEELYKKHCKYLEDGSLNPGGGLPLRVSDIDEMIMRTEGLVKKGFVAYFNDDETAFQYGKNYLSFKMAKRMVLDFLEEERRFINAPNSVVILGLEKKIQVPMKLTIHGQEKHILLNGTIDRIDEVNGQIRLIDYKTGMTDEKKLTLKDTDDAVKIFNESKHLAQLLMYCYMYFHSEGRYASDAGIFSMMRIKQGLNSMILGDATVEELVAYFPHWIASLLEQMYDVEIPFEHEAKSRYCTYCK